jgi:hypothetical protein
MSKDNIAWVFAFILNTVILLLSYLGEEPNNVYNSAILIGIAYLIFKEGIKR